MTEDDSCQFPDCKEKVSYLEWLGKRLCYECWLKVCAMHPRIAKTILKIREYKK